MWLEFNSGMCFFQDLSIRLAMANNNQSEMYSRVIESIATSRTNNREFTLWRQVRRSGTE